MTKSKRTPAALLKTKTVRAEIFGGDDGNTLRSVGFEVENGVLKSMPQPLSPQNVTCQGVNTADYFAGLKATLILDENMNVRMWKHGSEPSVVGSVHGSTPAVFYLKHNTMQAYRIVSGTEQLIVYQSGESTVESMPFYVVCGAYHYDRLFVRTASEPNRLRFSAPQLENWDVGADGGGYIDLNAEGGEILRILSVGEKLVVLRSHGVDVVSAMGDLRHFSVKPYLSFRIKAPVALSAVAVEGRVWFCTEDKLYLFNGATLEEKPLNIDLNGYAFCRAVYLDGRYLYISARKEADYFQVRYDTLDGRAYVCLPDCSAVWRTPSGMFCIRRNVVYSVGEAEAVGAGEGARWHSKVFNLNSPRRKCLKHLYADCDAGITVSAVGEQSRTFKGAYSGSVGICSERFVFIVQGCGSLRKLTAEWEVPV